MAKLSLAQKNQQKLTPQQLQMIGLLQFSNKDLERRIEKEIVENTLLERVGEDLNEEPTLGVAETSYKENIVYQGFSPRKNNGPSRGYEGFAAQQVVATTRQEQMMEKLRLLVLDEEEQLIAQHIIGSLTDEGYLKSSILMVVEEIAINHYKEVSSAKVGQVLKTIQSLGPAGIAARDLQECLTLQLLAKKQTSSVKKALQVIQHHFKSFTKKKYKQIAEKMGLALAELQPVITVIGTLRAEITPKMPTASETYEWLNPDFIVEAINGKIEVTLIKKTHGLRVRKQYHDLLVPGKKGQAGANQALVGFIREKINRAAWFIQALKKREETLSKIMRAIVHRQERFFESGLTERLKPLFLRHIAEDVGMDVSTISRAVAHKVVQTAGHTYPLRFFFSEAIKTTDGKEISSSVVKLQIEKLVAKEDKRTPMTDDMITGALKKLGYKLARRTVAKYRQLLGIPTSRMRRNPLTA
ncbi:MAG: RNA polymerase factor sigma-54 [Cytophagales bacterium]